MGQIPDEDRNQLAMDMFGKNSWEDLDTHEKRQATGHWVGQQRSAAGGGSPKASSTKKKGK